MIKKQQIDPQVKKSDTSKLSMFSLGFEYDKTLVEVKREVRIRTFQ